MADAAYLSWLRNEPCAMQPCISRSEAHHSTAHPAAPSPKGLRGKRGKGQKAADEHSFALCPRHHSQFHGAGGPFRDWDNAQRNAWQKHQVDIYRTRYLATKDPSTLVTNVVKQKVSRKPKGEAAKLRAELDSLLTQACDAKDAATELVEATRKLCGVAAGLLKSIDEAGGVES